MNVLRTSKLGELGEQMACDCLESRGQHILDRNWRAGHQMGVAAFLNLDVAKVYFGRFRDNPKGHEDDVRPGSLL